MAKTLLEATLISVSLAVLAAAADRYIQPVYVNDYGRKLGTVTAHTNYGKVVGARWRHEIDCGGRTNHVDHFLGIPYAKPPVGKLRFEPPEPPVSWTGTRRAHHHPPSCHQIPNQYPYTRTAYLNEDCLYLNVYVPYEVSDPGMRYPVMFFIHGGSYTIGAAAGYPGEVLAQQGLVVVVINYRLALLGFLNNDDRSFPGNYGMQDVLEGLRWVRQNIGCFRGDPDRVTIMGNSAGAGMVGLLSISPLAKGLFKYAIAQSGAPNAAWAVMRRQNRVVEKTWYIALTQHCRDTDSTAIKECLQKVPPGRFAYSQVHPPHVVPPLGINYLPRVDGTLIPDFPGASLRERPLNPEAYMTGLVGQEMVSALLPYMDRFRELYRAETEGIKNGLPRVKADRLVVDILQHVFNLRETTAEVIRHAYTDWKRLQDPVKTRNRVAQLFSDKLMDSAVYETARTMTERRLPVFLYHFLLRDETSSKEEWWRHLSYHGFEVNHVFGTVFLNINVENGEQQNFTETDRKISRKMMKMWTNFAYTGNPSSTEHTWRRFNSSTSDYLEFGPHGVSMKKHFRAEKMALWTDLIPRLDNNSDYLTSGKSAAITTKIHRPLLLLSSWIFVNNFLYTH